MLGDNAVLDLVMNLLIRNIEAVRAVILVLLVRFIFAKLHVPKKAAMALWLVLFALLIIPWRIPVSYWFPGVGTEWLENQLESSISGKDTDAATVLLEGADGPTAVWISQGTAIGPAGPDGDDTDIRPSQGGEPSSAQSAQNEASVGRSDTGSPIVSFRRISRVRLIFALWLAGAAVFLLIALVQGLLLKKRLSTAVREGEALISDEIVSPMVFGYLPPEIYLPTGLDDNIKTYVMAHERTHIRRLDPAWKLVAYIITCLNWFDPFVWLSFIKMSADMEMTCDEETVKLLGGEDEKKAYAEALLSVAVGDAGRRIFYTASPINFEEGDAGSRIKNLAGLKKAGPIAIGATVIAGIIMAALLFTKRQLPAGAVVMENPAGAATEEDDSDTSSESTYIFEGEQTGGGAVYEESRDYLPEESITSEPTGDADWYEAVLASSAELPPYGSWYAFVPVAGQEHPALLITDGTWEEDGEAHTFSCDVYWRIGSTCLSAGSPSGAGTAYPIRADESGLYITNPHSVVHYLLDTERGSLEVARFITADYDSQGDAYYDFSGVGADGVYEDRSLTEDEYNKMYEELSEAPAVAFRPISELAEHQYSSGDEEKVRGEDWTWEELISAFRSRTLHETDYRTLGGANVEHVIPGGTLNYYAKVPVRSDDGVSYEIRASYRVRDDALENIYLYRPSDGDNLWIWRSPSSEWSISVEDQGADGYISEEALNKFFARATYDINEHVKLELPVGYEIGAYRADIGWGGGAFILPQVYFPEGGFAPDEWKYAGFVGFIDAAATQIEFNNGLPGLTGLPMNNHTERSEIQYLPTADSSNRRILYFTEERDLYTAAELYDYEEENGEPPEESVSSYHCFCFPEEGEEKWLWLELSAKVFSSDEAARIALSAVYDR